MFSISFRKSKERKNEIPERGYPLAVTGTEQFYALHISVASLALALSNDSCLLLAQVNSVSTRSFSLGAFR